MRIKFSIGAFVVAVAGHDSGKFYVILQMDSEYVYLVDGKIRTLDRPKKKKLKHVRMLSEYHQELADKVKTGMIRDEEIKRAIKLLRRVDLDKGGKTLLQDKGGEILLQDKGGEILLQDKEDC